MIKNSIGFLALLGVILFILGILYKAVKASMCFEREPHANKSVVFLLERITKYGIISAPLSLISKNERLLVNRYLNKILELGEAGISLAQFHLVKLLCFLIFTVLCVAVLYSNTNYQARILIETSGSEKTLQKGDTSDQSKYQLYKQILKNIDADISGGNDCKENYNIVEQAVAESLNISDSHALEEKTEWFLNVRQEIKRLQTIRPEHLVLIFLSLFIPDIFMVIRWLIRGSVYKREIIKLEYVFELLSRVEGLKTLDIIYQLGKASKIYSKYLLEFSYLFKYDKIKAFTFLKSRNIKSLTKIANIIEIYSLIDKETALQVLEREIIERDEAMFMTAEETVDFIDLAAFLSIVPLVYELARLMIDPMLDVVYKAFEYI